MCHLYKYKRHMKETSHRRVTTIQRVFMKNLENKRKDCYLKARVTREQYKMINEICRTDEITVSELLRLYICEDIAEALEAGKI
jgi:hypothetical protein